MNCTDRVYDVSLVGNQDPSFVEWSRRMRKLHPKHRPGDPYVADYQKMLSLLEECARQRLAQDLWISRDRVVKYRHMNTDGTECLEFRELDTVLMSSNQPVCVVEMKFREQGATIFKGVSQLEKSLSVLRDRWPEMNGIFLCFWMAPIHGLQGLQPEILNSLAEVGQFAGQPASASICTFCVDGRHFLAEAIEARLWTPERTRELVELRRSAYDPLSTMARGSTGSNFNALGRLFGTSLGLNS